jgi:hypothetical protein
METVPLMNLSMTQRSNMQIQAPDILLMNYLQFHLTVYTRRQRKIHQVVNGFFAEILDMK